MCQSKAYLIARGVESEVMNDVVKIHREGNHLVLSDMRGATRKVENAYVGDVDTLTDKIVLYERDGQVARVEALGEARAREPVTAD